MTKTINVIEKAEKWLQTEQKYAYQLGYFLEKGSLPEAYNLPKEDERLFYEVYSLLSLEVMTHLSWPGKDEENPYLLEFVFHVQNVYHEHYLSAKEEDTLDYYFQNLSDTEKKVLIEKIHKVDITPVLSLEESRHSTAYAEYYCKLLDHCRSIANHLYAKAYKCV